jgi:hypothetical protein
VEASGARRRHDVGPVGLERRTVCVRPLRGEPSGIVDGKPWCGAAYPSRGLQIADVTVGSSVRVVTFTGTDQAGTDVSWVLVLPGDLPNPPAA